nr:hypothetical protein [Tanacetum cinerariifolium]
PLDGIFCHQCTCESCGKGAHYGYNCPSKVSIIPSPEPFNNQTIDEHPQTLPSFDSTCYSGNESPFTCDSTPNIVDYSSNIFNPPPQPPKYSYEFCGNDAYYGYDCPPQVPFTYDSEPFYNQDFNFPQNSQNFNNNIFVGPRMRLFNNSCYNFISFGFDQFLPQQLLVINQTPLEESMKNLRIAFQDRSENIQQKNKEEEKQTAVEQAAKAQY